MLLDNLITMSHVSLFLLIWTFFPKGALQMSSLLKHSIYFDIGVFDFAETSSLPC